MKNQKKKSKVTRKLGEYIFSHENPKSFWGPKAGPRSHPYICSFRSHDSGPLHQQNWADQSWAPLGQILDPLLCTTHWTYIYVHSDGIST